MKIMLPSRRKKRVKLKYKRHIYKIDRSLHSHIFKGVCDISLFVYEKKQICTYFPDHAVVVSTIKYKGKMFPNIVDFSTIHV